MLDVKISKDKYFCITHSFPVHPFSTPWKHQKTVRFSAAFLGGGGGGGGVGKGRKRVHLERMG